jgi:hypothetical protein
MSWRFLFGQTVQWDLTEVRSPSTSVYCIVSAAETAEAKLSSQCKLKHSPVQAPAPIRRRYMESNVVVTIAIRNSKHFLAGTGRATIGGRSWQAGALKQDSIKGHQNTKTACFFWHFC